MEISASEIGVLSKRINDSISGYTVSGVYSIDGGIVLRLRHESKIELLIAISSFAPWITTKNLTLPQAEHFVINARDFVERSKLKEVKQSGSERIAEFSFEKKNGETNSLFAEFFGKGNLILVDQNGIILVAEKTLRLRHRILAPGEKYVLPPSRGINLSDVDSDTLDSLFRRTLRNEETELTAIKWFGRNVGTSRKFVEDIFERSGVKPDLSVGALSRFDLESLANASEELLHQLESSNKGFLLIPTSEDEEAEVDVCSFVPSSWRSLIKEGRATVREFQTLSEGLDEAQVQSLVLTKKQLASQSVRSKAAELEAAISKQDSLVEKNKKASSELRALARKLMSSEDEKSDFPIQELVTLGVLEKNEIYGGGYQFVNEPRSFLNSLGTTRALASRLFDESKRLEERNQIISDVREGLERKKQELLEQTTASEDRVSKRTELEHRPREWFERYRWFLTSDSRLAVGGRDSTSNSIVINKYTTAGDFVFHADLHGSPFFILKSSPEKTILGDDIEQELAQATVSFSHAWKDELASADAFWVNPDQVKKSAPSGEYLPRGSFFIEGKKNFVKHVRVELSIGIMSSNDLREISGQSPKDSGETAVVVCGPEKSLKKYCVASVKIAPGKERSTSIAKKIKQLLVGKMKGSRLNEVVKRLSIDDVIRVLPSGSYKLVSEKQNH